MPSKLTKIKYISILLLVVVLLISACNRSTTAWGWDPNNIANNSCEEFDGIKAPTSISEIYNDSSKLKLTADAEVLVPQVPEYPVTEVQKRILSDDDISSFIQICLDSSSYDLFSDWYLSKNEWKEVLEKANEYKDSGILSQDYYNYLNESYNSAPSQVTNTSINLDDFPQNIQSIAYVKGKNDVISKIAFKRNDNFFVYYRDMFLETYASEYADNQFDENYDTIESFKWHQPDEPEISQKEAYDMALKYIDKMNIDLKLFSAEPCAILLNQCDKSTGWMFTFTRTISDLQAQYWDIWTYTNPESSPAYGAPWEQEICRIVIDKRGLCKLWLQGASKINSTIIDSSQLIEFDSIKDKMIAQLKSVYGSQENDQGVGLEINISIIELGISLVSFYNHPEAGVYIPTWYITFDRKWIGEDEWNPTKSQIMLNAIDGSYIESRITTADLNRLKENQNLSHGQ